VGPCASWTEGCNGNHQGGVVKVCAVPRSQIPFGGYSFTDVRHRVTNRVAGDEHIHSVYMPVCSDCALPDDFYHSVVNHEYGHAIQGGGHSFCCGLQLMSPGSEPWLPYRRFQSWHDIADLQWTYNHVDLPYAP